MLALIGLDRCLVGDDLVEFLLIVLDRLLVRDDRRLIRGDLVELCLVLLDLLLSASIFSGLREDRSAGWQSLPRMPWIQLRC